MRQTILDISSAEGYSVDDLLAEEAEQAEVIDSIEQQSDDVKGDQDQYC